MTTARAGDAFGMSRGDLLGDGWRPRDITVAVRSGSLIRCRNGVYVTPDMAHDVRIAASLGARLDCITALRRREVFVLGREGVHVRFARKGRQLRRHARVRRHWGTPLRMPHPRSLCVEPLDALVHAARCSEPRAFVATVDSALRQGVVAVDDLDDLFRALPRRFRVLRRMCDGLPESGPESLLRWMLRKLGCRYELQVIIRGVGRVDFLVDGWLIVECDSAAHHSGWDERRRDLRRDQAAAALGYATYRPIAEDIMWNPDIVWTALGGLIRSRR